MVLQICLFLRYCLVFTSKFNSYSDFVFFGLQVSCISIWFFVFTKKTMQLLILVFSAVSSFQQGNSWKKDEFCISFGSFFNVFSFDQYFFCRFKQFFFGSLADSIRPQCPLPQRLIMWTSFSWHYGPVRVEFWQARWPWNSNTRQMKWQQMKLRWVKTEEAMRIEENIKNNSRK